MTDELTAIRERWAEYNDGRPHMLDWYLDRDGKLARDVGTLLALVDQQQAALLDVVRIVIERLSSSSRAQNAMTGTMLENAVIPALGGVEALETLLREHPERYQAYLKQQVIIDAAHKVVNASGPVQQLAINDLRAALKGQGDDAR